MLVKLVKFQTNSLACSGRLYNGCPVGCITCLSNWNATSRHSPILEFYDITFTCRMLTYGVKSLNNHGSCRLISVSKRVTAVFVLAERISFMDREIY